MSAKQNAPAVTARD